MSECEREGGGVFEGDSTPLYIDPDSLFSSTLCFSAGDLGED